MRKREPIGTQRSQRASASPSGHSATDAQARAHRITASAPETDVQMQKDRENNKDPPFENREEKYGKMNFRSPHWGRGSLRTGGSKVFGAVGRLEPIVLNAPSV